MKFDNATKALPGLLKQLMDNGEEVGSRVGRTKELSPVQITLDKPWEREILTPHRRASLPAQIAETMWVLAGRNDVEWLKRYLPRAPDFSDDGETWRGGYGPRLRRWKGNTDQLAYVVELLRRDPMTRRAVMVIYDPELDQYEGKDIPCNNWIHFLSRLGRLDMHVAVRSNDAFWGWSGINAFEWSALQEIVAGMLGIQVGRLTFSASSFHLYDRHWGRANEIIKSRDLEPGRDKDVRFDGRYVVRDTNELGHLIRVWFDIEDEIRAGLPGAEERVNAFPEPMLQAWLRVIGYYWSNDEAWLGPLQGTALKQAAVISPKRKVDPEEAVRSIGPDKPFVTYVSTLHNDKHKAYGDSWKRRGEMLGIMANVARKVDRLGVSGAGDTATDTAVDLLCYLVKYRWWLYEFAAAPCPVGSGYDQPTDKAEPVTDLLFALSAAPDEPVPMRHSERYLQERFEQLAKMVEVQDPDRWELVDKMIRQAYALAAKLWWQEQNETRTWKGYDA